jgi:hypothetical protein
MLDGDEVMRGHLTRSQILIVSESMPSTRSIPVIRSLGVGGWVSVNRSISICYLVVTALPLMKRHAAGVVDVARYRAKADVDGVSEDVLHALRDDDAVGRSH